MQPLKVVVVAVVETLQTRVSDNLNLTTKTLSVSQVGILQIRVTIQALNHKQTLETMQQHNKVVVAKVETLQTKRSDNLNLTTKTPNVSQVEMWLGLVTTQALKLKIIVEAML
jgi:hypothetical protein